jgi:hypothetical protein
VASHEGVVAQLNAINKKSGALYTVQTLTTKNGEALWTMLETFYKRLKEDEPRLNEVHNTRPFIPQASM